MAVKNCEVVVLVDLVELVMLICIPVTEGGMSQASLGVDAESGGDSVTSLARGRANLE